MRTSVALVGVALAACGRPTFLGARVGAHCTDYQACRVWARDQVTRTSPLLVYDDPAVHDYVAAVLARLIRANRLTVAPVVRMTATGTAWAAPSDAIHINHDLLAALDSEAALAAVLAHELAHVEARTGRWLEGRGDAEQLSWRRALESIADERAVGYVIAAGYEPGAMLDMLRAVARFNPRGDDEHPTLLQRLSRVALVIAGRSGGELARDRYRQHLDGIVIGGDPRVAAVIDDNAVSLAIGVTIDGQGKAYKATIEGSPRGDLLIGSLRDRRDHQVAGHLVVTGIARDPIERVDPSVVPATREALDEELAFATRQPTPGAHVVVVRGPRADIWLEITGQGAARRAATLVAGIRTPTQAERARVHVKRLRFRPAKIAGEAAAVVQQTCPAPSAATLDDPRRTVGVGELVKCVEPVP
ncbi:MAG: Zn-dependent protease [Deltaproteobacteria bacterium]|nr:Zn-dependent protease [Deltaproteobacteria bacterium]